jgi:hypothetical protein
MSGSQSDLDGDGDDNDPTHHAFSGRPEERLRGVYLFCVTDAGTPAPSGPGLDAESSLYATGSGAVSAVVCDLMLDEWTGAEAEQRLQDLNWLGPRVMRHQAVIEQAMSVGPVLPLRFGSIFSSLESLRAWLASQSAVITPFLQQSRQFEEWSLKGWLDVSRAEATLLAGDPRMLALPSQPGARYLREQKLRQEIAKSVRSWARNIEGKVLGVLGPLVAAHRSLRALPGDASGRSEEVVFHHALLVPLASKDVVLQQIERLAEELAAQGVTLQISGPWPQYSFVPALGSQQERSGAESLHRG